VVSTRKEEGWRRDGALPCGTGVSVKERAGPVRERVERREARAWVGEPREWELGLARLWAARPKQGEGEVLFVFSFSFLKHFFN